jgi:glycosyltransferase involved in cell wall biosynthesis
MIRIGYFLSQCFPDEYPGGKNYMINLFEACKLNNEQSFEFVIFIGKKTSSDYAKNFEPYGQIVRSSLFDRKSFFWYVHKIVNKTFKSNVVANLLIIRHRIDIISHSDVYGKHLSAKTFNWVPDLQFLHLPQLWTDKGLKLQQTRFKDRLMLSDGVIFSSFDGEKDAIAYVPSARDKYFVVRPVYQIDAKYYSGDYDVIQSYLENKYSIKEKFFYLPNQFWVHKNHKRVFEACKILKDQNINIQVICTGLIDKADGADRRHGKYIKNILSYIADNDMSNQIKLLGMIDYQDVLKFMHNAISVINPSYFEGWSSTVEEAKSMGKSVILSDLDVHHEQNPSGARYFDPDNSQDLARILEDQWRTHVNGEDLNQQKSAQESLLARTLIYRDDYLKALDQIMNM